MVFTATLIASRESANIQQRGRSYIRRVKILKSSPKDIKAVVFGSFPYRTSIKKTAQGTYVDECSCPYGATCKHTIALAYVIEQDRKLKNALDNGEEISNRPLSSTQVLKQLHRIDRIYTHEQERTHPSNPYKPGRGLYYRIRRNIQEWHSYYEDDVTTENHYLAIEVGKYRLRTKNGRPTFVNPKNLSDILIDSSLQTTLDIKILRLLSYSAHKERYYHSDTAIRIANEIIDELFALLSLSAVVLWESESAPLHVATDKAQVLLENTITEKGIIWKPVLYNQGRPQMQTRNPEFFDYHPPVVKVGDTLYQLQDDTHARIIREFMKLQSIKPDTLEDPVVIDKILDLSQRTPIRLPVRWEEQAVMGTPVPLLILDRQTTPWVIDVSFNYSGRTFPAATTVPHLFATIDTSNQIYKRDLAQESELLSQIRTLLQVEEEFPPFRILSEKHDYFFNTVLTELPTDWQIELKGQKSKINRSSAEFDFEQKSGINWLDIDGTVKFDTQSVRLYELLDEVMKEEPFIVLKGNAYLLSLKDKSKLARLASHYDRKEKKISFSPVHIGVLSELEDVIDTSALPESWKNTVSALRGFTSIKQTAVPKQLNATLRPYQQEGVNWLSFLREFHFGGILADDMGLGKTIQTLTILALAYEDKSIKKPSLVVAPTSVVYNWQKEIERFTPSLKPYIYAGKNRNLSEATAVDVIITSYALLWRDREVFTAQQFHYVILDEAHYIKNHKSKTAQTARNLNADHRLSLTGTPLENNLTELWSQCAFVNPDLLGSLERFKQMFVTPIEKYQNQDSKTHLQRLLKPFFLRRLKQDVVRELPSKTEQILWCELDDKQRMLYESMKQYYQAKVFKLIDQKGIQKSQIEILEALLRLRQICCHPRLLKLEERKSYPFLPPLLRDVKSSVKLDTVIELVETAIAEGHKILLFSQFVSMLEIIEKELLQRKIYPLKLTGDTPIKDRQDIIDRFQTENANPIFLLSLKAGGTGLNLTAADYVIHYDPWWNPAVEAQATDRTHRIGQTKPVFVYKTFVKDSIEEKIQALQEKKKGLIEDIIGGSSHGKGLTRKDLEFLFR